MSDERPWSLAAMPYARVREETYHTVVLPWGATEAHNLHLPYATDIIESEHVADRAAALAWSRGARVLVLPAVPFGVQTGQLDIPYCINLPPSTQLALLRDIVTSVEPHGASAFVIVNGHGGNDFKQMIRELQPETPLFLSLVNWYTVVPPRDWFDDIGDHAGEIETSVMQHIAPSLVLPLDEAGDGAARPSALRAIREGWAWAPRRWTQVTRDTGIGDPSHATAEKGERYLRLVIERIASYFVELESVDLREPYQ